MRGMLNEQGGREAGQRAQAMLRPLLGRAAEDPVFQQTFARASETRRRPVRAGEAYAEAAFLNGRPEQALMQLQTLKKREDLDYYARARIDARIATITPHGAGNAPPGHPRPGPGPALSPTPSCRGCHAA